MTLDHAFSLLPPGWAVELRSYEDGAVSCELCRFADMPLAETGGPVVRNSAATWEEAIELSASEARAIEHSNRKD